MPWEKVHSKGLVPNREYFVVQIKLDHIVQGKMVLGAIYLGNQLRYTLVSITRKQIYVIIVKNLL